MCVSLSRGGRVVLCAALEDLSELKIVELASTGHGRTSHHLINLHNRDSAREEVTSTAHQPHACWQHTSWSVMRSPMVVRSSLSLQSQSSISCECIHGRSEAVLVLVDGPCGLGVKAPKCILDHLFCIRACTIHSQNVSVGMKTVTIIQVKVKENK